MDLNTIISQARELQCSDIHLAAGTAVCVRQFGKLFVLNDDIPSLEETENLIYTLLTPSEVEYVKAGHDLDVAVSDDLGRIRMNVYHQRNNVAACIRLFDNRIPSFNELGLPDIIESLTQTHSGLVLVTGPTGSGKSTTLASMVDYINHTQPKHIITVEDPIEYIYKFDMAMIHQRQIGKDVPDYSTALRSALREDPDIIMVGEMRDYETINAAITAAETGHLVVSTLHTRSAAQTVERVISACPSDMQDSMRMRFSQVLEAVITQDLVPEANGGGRAIATEVLLNTPAISNLIHEDKIPMIHSTLQSNSQSGMHTMNMSLLELVHQGIITRAMAIEHSNDPEEFKKMM